MEDQRISRLERRKVDLPPASSGGGPVGIVNIGNVSGSVKLYPADDEIYWADVRYNEPEVIHGTGNWITYDGSDIILAPGYYIPVFYPWLRWLAADAPNHVQVYMGGGVDWAHQGSTTVAPVLNYDSSQAFVNGVFNHGATYMSGTDYLRAEVQFSPTPGPLLAGATHAWTITKLS